MSASAGARETKSLQDAIFVWRKDNALKYWYWWILGSMRLLNLSSEEDNILSRRTAHLPHWDCDYRRRAVPVDSHRKNKVPTYWSLRCTYFSTGNQRRAPQRGAASPNRNDVAMELWQHYSNASFSSFSQTMTFRKTMGTPKCSIKSARQVENRSVPGITRIARVRRHHTKSVGVWVPTWNM